MDNRISCNSKCPLFHVEVDTLCETYCSDMADYQEEIRAEVIDEFVNKCEKRIEETVLEIEDDLPFLDIFDIQKIAEQLKGE